MNVLFPIYIRENNHGKLDTEAIEKLMDLYLVKWQEATIHTSQAYKKLDAMRMEHPDMSEETEKMLTKLTNYVADRLYLLALMEKEYCITKDWIRKKKEIEKRFKT